MRELEQAVDKAIEQMEQQFLYESQRNEPTPVSDMGDHYIRHYAEMEARYNRRLNWATAAYLVACAAIFAYLGARLVGWLIEVAL